jgi:lipoprotein-anchoring transpeptidase ErfK/SrfK
LTSADFDGDGLAEIVVAPNGPGSGPEQITIFDRAGKVKTTFETSAVAYAGGLLIAAGRLGVTDGELILVVPANQDAAGRPTLPKFIAVNVTDQRLRAYEYGHEVNTFLVSTGTLKYPTPLGGFSILAKVPKVRFAWVYGADNPDNYDLGWTPWSLKIMPHIYIHYAPWHNKFGHRVSHGCVNVNLTNILWIYKWAEVGVPVSITE